MNGSDRSHREVECPRCSSHRFSVNCITVPAALAGPFIITDGVGCQSLFTAFQSLMRGRSPLDPPGHFLGVKLTQERTVQMEPDNGPICRLHLNTQGLTVWPCNAY